MRTTLEVDDDVLLLAKEIAKRERKTAGEVISSLARAGWESQRGGAPAAARRSARGSVLGFRVVPPRGGVVTNALIDRLREQDAY